MKKIISIALALLMVAVMLPVMAMAEGATKEVSTQEELTAAVANGGEVTLGANITASITIPAGRTVTLNLNGKTLKNEDGKDTITVELGGILIVEGDGKVDNTSDGCAAIFNNGTVTLNGGTFDRSAETSTGKTKEERGNNSWYTICNHGTLTINSGVTITTANKATDKGRYSSLIENGYQNYAGDKSRVAYKLGTNQEYPSLLINGGEFFGGINTIKNDDNGIATINGGSSTNYYQASVQNHHKMVIENGSFSGETAWSVLNCGADCVYNADHDAHELVIKNGNFKGDVRANVGSVKIEGGNFESSFTKEGNATIEISGGTFKKDIDKSYIVDGKKLDANGNVVPETITIIVPSEGGNTTTTPSTDNTKNPGTGANDFVGVAAAMAVVSLLGAAAVIRKK